MASLRTQLTELGTAVGIYTDADSADRLATVSVPGLLDDAWRPVLVPALGGGPPSRRAAEQALSMNVRRILIEDDRGVTGIVGGLDFARVMS